MKLDFIFKLLSRARPGLFWLHLCCGVTAGAVILVLSATGVLLAYQRQLTAWADAMPRVAPAAGAVRLPIAHIVESARRPGGPEPSAVVIRSDPSSPVTVAAGRGAPAFVDPYTGEVVGRGSERARAFFQAVTSAHRWLAASGSWREAGRGVAGAATLAFLFILASGVWLWWPRRWSRRALAAAALPSLRLSGKARDFNWHNAVGVWSALPLLIVVPCGVVLSYPWAGDLVHRVFGERPPGRSERRARDGGASAAPSLAGLDALVAAAGGRAAGWKTITLRLPIPAEGPVTLTVDHGEGVRPDQRAQIALGRTSAEIVRWEPYASLSPGRRARAWVRWLHTGEAFGAVGQGVAAAACAGAVVLACTGLALAWRRLRGWRAARRPAARPLPSLDPSTESGGLP